MSLRDKLKKANVVDLINRQQGLAEDQTSAMLRKYGINNAFYLAKMLKMRKGLVKRSETAAKKRKTDAEDDQHEDKIPKPDLKKVWQQHEANPFNQILKSNPTQDLNALPGMAAAALSQHFTTHGFMLLKPRSFTAGSGNDQMNQLADVLANLILEGEYGDEAHEELRKDNTLTFKNLEKKYLGYANQMHDVVISLANIVSESNSVKGFLESDFSIYQK